MSSIIDRVCDSGPDDDDQPFAYENDESADRNMAFDDQMISQHATDESVDCDGAAGKIVYWTAAPARS